MPTYPLSLPSSPAFTISGWGLQRNTGLTESPFTGAQQVVEFEYGLWYANLQLPPMKRDLAVEWQAFLVQLHGRRGTFLLGDPDAKQSRGAANGTITLSTSASSGDLTLDLNSASQQSTTGILKTGDYIQIGGGSAAKLHMVCADVNSDASGNFTITIEPAIKTGASSGTSIVHQNTVGVFRLTDDSITWDTNIISNYGITIACKEAL